MIRIVRIVSLLFFLTNHPINLNSAIYISARLTSVSKSCWIRLCLECDFYFRCVGAESRDCTETC